MATIINIEEFRNKKRTPQEEAREELRKVLNPLKARKSNEETIQFYMEQAERDRQEEMM